MAEPTQLAYRTLKGIGVFNAAPVYEALSGFVPYVAILPSCHRPKLTKHCVDLRAIFAAAPILPTASSLPGHRLNGTYTSSNQSVALS
jgi:hypothetical protein